MSLQPIHEELNAQEALEPPVQKFCSLPVDGKLPLKSLDLVDLSTKHATPKQYAIEGIAPIAEVTLLTGPGSAGKSLIGQQFATAAASGMNCLGLSVASGPAIYLTCEDDADQLHFRQQHLCEAARVDMASLAGKLHLISLRGELDTHFCTFASDGALEEQVGYRQLAAKIDATGAKLVILDNVAHLFTGNENDRGHVTKFINLLNRLAGKSGAAIMLIAHPNKSGDNYSGSTAWLNAVRSQVTIDMQRDKKGTVIDPDARILAVSKANYSQIGEVVRFRWHNWVFVRDEDLQPYIRAEIRYNSEDNAFLKCLAVATASKRAVSHNPSPSYYATVFPKMQEGKRYKKEAYQRAFERLLDNGQIELDARLWQRDNRAWQQGIRAVEKCTQYHARHTARDDQ